MIFYSILHVPTNTLFPNIPRGSSWFDFGGKVPSEPRLFRRRSTATAFLTNYLKGPLGRDDEGCLRHITPKIPRNRHDFVIATVELEITNV
jgi:hypothetical protein